MRLALLLLALAAPLSAQTRTGFCYLNVGQLVAEPVNHVRSGNMGGENACVSLSVGSRWYMGGKVAITPLAAFPKQDDLSRWSHRPHGMVKQVGFVWVHPEVGYRFPVGPLSIAPNVGLWWPAATTSDWGAPVGPVPSVGLEVAARWGMLELAVDGAWAYKGRERWTVLDEWAAGWGPFEKRAHHLFPVSLTVRAVH